MDEKQTLLSELHQARLDRLKEICDQDGISKNGSNYINIENIIAEIYVCTICVNKLS